MNKKGFTLMEILAVLLILAVVTMFAIPAVRGTRALVQHHRAKSAALEMASAMRSYYQTTKGYLITGELRGKLIDTDDESVTIRSVVTAADQACNNPAVTGIPPTGSNRTSNMIQLFACDYLSTKDFAGLPYTFTADNDPFTSSILLTVTGTADAGKYNGQSFTVHRDGSIKDVE